MSDPAESSVQNLLPVQAYFDAQDNFQTFIGQNKPFYATTNPEQSGLHITDSTIDSTTIGADTPSTGVFTNVSTTTGQVSTAPVTNTDIANKQYVDAVAQGLKAKQAVKCATTGDIVLLGLQTIDTYTTLAGDRVLVKDQLISSQNGIYIASAGAWTRSTDMDVWSEVPGSYTVALNGSTNLDTGWVCTAAETGTIGVTAMPWVQFSGSATYYAGTGLTLAANTFSITNTGVTAATKGSASKTVTATVNAQGQLTSLTDQDIAIAGTQITSGTIDSARLSGSYTGITGVGTLATGTWQADTISVSYGGTGATSLTGYVKGNGTSAFTASSTVPTTDLSGTISNAQLANSTISGVSLGSNLANLTFSTGITASSSTYNGGTAVTISNAAPMTYPGAGIANSTGTSWGTSYSTTGTGTVVALATAATLNNPTVSDYTAYTPTTAPTYAEGRVFYDSSAHTLNYYNDNSQMSLNIGQEQIVRVRNQTGSLIPNGTVVYVSGATGQTPLISLAIATSYTTADVIGVTTTDISNNGFGYVTISGTVNGLDTSAFSDGAAVYLSASAAGTYTATEPTSPNYSIQIGVVIYSHGVNGKLLVAIQTKSVESQHIVGQVAISNGGTNGTATPTAGAVAYGTGSAYAFSSAGTIGQVLTSNGSSAPTWTTPASAITISDDTTTNSTRYPLFANQTTGSASTEYVSSTKLQYNPSTGVFTSTSFSGAGTGLTGTASSLSIGGNAATATSATTATNLAGGASGSMPYQTGSGTTAMLAKGSDGQILTLASGLPSWAAAPATGITITDDTTTNSTRYLTFTDATTGSITGENVSSTKLQYNPSTGTLNSTVHAAVGSANTLTTNGSATTFATQLINTGSDTNISMAFKTKGTGAIDLAAGSSGVNISNGGTVTAITRTAVGSGYTSVPSVVITAPTTAGGVQATATCFLQHLTNSIASGGSGYTVGDTVTATGGTSVVAVQFTVATVSAGVVTGLTLTNFGQYSVLPSNPVSFTGGTGTGLTLNITWCLNQNFIITNAGSGYVEQPTVSFSGGGGSGAAAYATVGSGATVKGLGSTLSFSLPSTELLRLTDAGTQTTAYWSVFQGSNTPVLRGIGTSQIVFESNSAVPLLFRTSSGTEQFRVAHTASAVNYVQVTGSATTAAPTVTVAGSDANIALNLQSKLAAPINFYTSGGYQQFKVNNTATAANYLQVAGSVASSAPILSSQGSDTNIDLALTPKGTGVVRGNGVAVSSENGIYLNKQTVATSMTVPSGYSASSTGPVTLSSGVTVTVSSGSKWVVL